MLYQLSYTPMLWLLIRVVSDPLFAYPIIMVGTLRFSILSCVLTKEKSRLACAGGSDTSVILVLLLHHLTTNRPQLPLVAQISFRVHPRILDRWHAKNRAVLARSGC